MSRVLKEFIQLCVENKWWKDPSLHDPDSPNFMSQEEIYAKKALEPEYAKYVKMFTNAAEPKELSKAKRTVLKAMDNGETDMSDGMMLHFFEKRKAEFAKMNWTPRSSAEARTDAILRTRDSTGRAKSRKF